MLLEVKQIDGYYGDTKVLEDMSLEINQGEIVALMGRNGMGKSTTFKCIINLIDSKQGQIFFKGKDITNMATHQIAKAGIGYVNENKEIFSNLTVLENLQMGIKHGKIEADALDPWSLERVSKHFPILGELSKNKGEELSGGEQQMLALARCLMGNPELMLVDEPTEGLAPIIVREVRDMLAEIKKTGVAIIVVDHNIKVALSLADRIYLMGKGYLGFHGTVAELEAQPDMKSKYLEV